MKEWFVGVDGGGSKTAFAAARRDGVPAARLEEKGSSYVAIGIPAAVQRISEGVRACLSAAGLSLDDCAAVCIGLPCYGESAENDPVIAGQLRLALRPAEVFLENDVVVAWRGALSGREGIHIVSGTGAIAYGQSRDGTSARCGGWTEFFSDEGSCYWVGRNAMSLFSKQADGRIPRNALYEIVRRELSLTDDYAFIDRVLSDWAPYRDRVASFQRFTLEAANRGDPSARQLYADAAGELASLAAALKRKLPFEGPRVPVTYSGGLFHAADWVLPSFREKILAEGCFLEKPAGTPVDGALQIAMEQYRKEISKCI